MDSLESFWSVWKLSRPSGMFPNSLETFPTNILLFAVLLHIYYNFVRKVLALWHVCHDSDFGTLAHICRESDLRTFAAYKSRKRFTHSVRKVLTREILPTGKF